MNPNRGARPLRPFAQGRFEDLPEVPTRPHVYDESEALEVELASSSFGTMRVHVRRYGEGPPLLLVHGLMTSSYSWRYAFKGLGQHYTCYAPDLPGAGRSDRPLAPSYRPQALARWLLELQATLGIQGCRVVGNSMGGYLSMQMALLEPSAISHLVNLHSPGVPEFRLFALGAALALPGVKRLLEWLVRRDPLRWAHRNVHYYDESFKSLEEARAYGEPLRSSEGARAFIKYLSETMNIQDTRAFRDTLLRRRQEDLPFPTPLLLLYAEKDPMVPPRFGAQLAAWIPSATLLHLPEASHFAHVDAVERFLPPVLEFLSQSPRPT